MKRFLVITMALMLVVGSLAGCAGEQAGDDTSEIALITDKGNIDDRSFNQGAWEGVVEFAEANDISHTYIKPEEASDAGYLAAIDLAVQGGAEVIVTPGFLFEVPIYEAQTKYPDVKFILLDGAPHTADYSTFETKDNVASIMYAEEESGFLAGYAAVKDGMTDLGFMGGMAVPAVQAFGYGYLQGAEYAAIDMGLEDGAIEVTYHYTGNFEENDTNKATAKTMYQEGVEVIFACGGSVGKSVMSAAAEDDAKVIGVDVDQRYDSETVITSAMKGLSASVVSVLESIYNDNFDQYSGQTTYFNAANDGVGLPTEVMGEEGGDAFDRFETFTKEEYDAIFSELADGNIDVTRTIEVEAETGYATAEELTEQLDLQKVSVTTR
ncbi:MAG: BMP family ABC transporter substrate-binding protein [Eubacteriales bacterium]